jgi:hypothetical protein
MLELDADFLSSFCFHADIDTRIRTCSCLYYDKLRLKTRVDALKGLDTVSDTIANGPVNG